MKLSDLLKESNSEREYKIYNEKEFEIFARITTKTTESRCVFLIEKKYISQLPKYTNMVITTEELKEYLLEENIGVCVCGNPKALYFELLNYLGMKEKQSFETSIGNGCLISEQAYIAPFNVKIGDNVTIEEFACVYEGSIIEDHCIIHSGAKIGIEDYNYYREEDQIKPVKHQGKTILKKNVEVGYNSVVGRGLYSYGKTYVDESCKIGCNSSIGHDVSIGRHVMVMANVVIAGHTVIEDDVNISIGASIKNALVIGEHAHIQMGATVIRDVAKNEAVFGNPAKRILKPQI